MFSFLMLNQWNCFCHVASQWCGFTYTVSFENLYVRLNKDKRKDILYSMIMLMHWHHQISPSFKVPRIHIFSKASGPGSNIQNINWHLNKWTFISCEWCTCKNVYYILTLTAKVVNSFLLDLYKTTYLNLMHSKMFSMLSKWEI